MEVKHLFEREVHQPEHEGVRGDLVETHYLPVVTPGCEWALSGEGEACRLHGKDGKTAPFVVIKNSAMATPDSELVSQVTFGEAWREGLKDGLYQLIEQEEKCPECGGRGVLMPPPIPTDRNALRKANLGFPRCKECKSDGKVTRPRLVRVGEEWDRIDYWGIPPKEGATPLEHIARVFKSDHPDWRGILFMREVECPTCEGKCVDEWSGSKTTEYRDVCPDCHGSGRIEEYAKVERGLMP